MLKSVKIENFRGFKSFELQQLGRINLLVGENNSGKTSILEAIQLLCSGTNLEPLGEIMINRGEYFWSDDPKEERELDICHLFYDHEFDIDSQFSISGIKDNFKEGFYVNIEKLKLQYVGRDVLDEVSEVFQLGEEFKRRILSGDMNFNFRVMWRREDELEEISNLYLSDNDCLYLRDIRRSSRDEKKKFSKTIFINSSSLNTAKMTELFEKVVLTPEEELATEALRIIDPKIERIATANVQKAHQNIGLHSPDSHTGFFVRLADRKQRVPIGSMGDGIWRILGLALAIVSAKDGYLFVDEIDTGLHFTTMSGMWKMIWDTAKRLNVQVFATTHNSDCWKSLADIAETENVTDDGIRIHRIEKDKETSIKFNEAEIIIAAERGIEVR
ncbi:MAG: AAA family ATPase [Dolichospermum sp. LBC05a]|jgi:AAA15 family ATPase/GTPase|nr:AAA family ATPase [Dolichospermum sp. OL01]MCO5796303.1 AAA family ATPase [Dolichospermum sp. OL03]MCS6281100.1 AAA family ATPase [Dolichospermum sp.]QSV57922.1 MAG: AAA family ATPase [Dolichospermum sp. LBC05a]